MENQIITFLLNNKIKTVNKTDPNTSLLNYLRQDLNHCGTKEGCASGDCGACTVVVGELHNNEIRYKSINACITFLAYLDGKQLLTVEDLKQDDELHPVQQSMLDTHASQCGFCTPGIVMSLFALQKNNSTPVTTSQTLEALSGNLCRCTGYRSILEAAQKMPTAKPDPYAATSIEKLQQIEHLNTTKLSYGKQRYFAPNHIDELAKLCLENPQAKLLAGGTDLALEVTQLHKDLNTIIYLGNVAQLQEIAETDTSFTLGAAVTYSQCHQLLSDHYNDLGEMLKRLGSLQIRNQATIGGNIANASPIGDMPPVLIALGASIVLQRGKQTRVLRVEDYFIDYKVTALQAGEFIQSIKIPKVKPGYSLKIYKISKRIDDDISALLGAFYLHIENQKISAIKLAFGGMAAIPKRATNAEESLLNKNWNETTIAAAMLALEQDFSPLSDVRASAQYRMQVAKNLLKKCYLELEFESQQKKTVTRVTEFA